MRTHFGRLEAWSNLQERGGGRPEALMAMLDRGFASCPGESGFHPPDACRLLRPARGEAPYLILMPIISGFMISSAHFWRKGSKGRTRPGRHGRHGLVILGTVEIATGRSDRSQEPHGSTGKPKRLLDPGFSRPGDRHQQGKRKKSMKRTAAFLMHTG